MSTIVGHALVGTAISVGLTSRLSANAKRWVLLTAVVASVLPDLDVMLLLALREGASSHRGLSHSVLAAGLVAAMFAAPLRRGARIAFGKAFVIVLIASLSHIALDWAMGTGPPVRPFAPFDDAAYLASARWVPTAYYARTAAGYGSFLFLAGNGFALLFEVLLFGPIIVAARRDYSARLRALAVATSAGAFVVVHSVFN